MTDILSPKQRSNLMGKIHGKDTVIEKMVRSDLHKSGYRFLKHVARLPGSPDIVLPKYKAVIFVHGCFWHGHSVCKKSRLPTTRRTFWEAKREANTERDSRKINYLLNLGWRVAVVWQCSLEKTANFHSTMKTLENWLSSELRYCEIPQKLVNTVSPR